MQTRLRSRLGLSGADELPDPIATSSVRRSASFTGTPASSDLPQRGVATSLVSSTPQPPGGTKKFAHTVRLKSSSSAVSSQPQQQQHHHEASDGMQRFDHVDAASVAPRTQWRRVFAHCTALLPFTGSSAPNGGSAVATGHHTSRVEQRRLLQSSLQATLMHALHRIRHEQRLEMIAADQETEFRDDILREARERKRQRRETQVLTSSAPGSTPSEGRKRIVIVDSDESDGVGGEECADGHAPTASAVGRHPSSFTKHNNSDDDDDDDDDGALRILKVIDRLDDKLASFAKRNSDASEAHRSAPLRLRGGRGRGASTAAACKSIGGLDGVVWAPSAHIERGTTQTPIYPRLLPFQRDGLHWMVDTVLVRRLNCVLADEMGLGKTVSTIALASSLASIKACYVQDPTNASVMASVRRQVHVPTSAKVNKAAANELKKCKVSSTSSKRPRRGGRNAHTVSDSEDDDNSDDDDEHEIVETPRVGAGAPLATASDIATLSSASSAVLSSSDPSPWVVAPTLVVAPLSTLPNWASEFRNFEPDRFSVFLINGSREEREEQLDAFFAALVVLQGVTAAMASSSGRRGGVVKKSTLQKGHRLLWGDDNGEKAAHRIPVLLVPHDYFARTLDTRGRRLVQQVRWELVVIDEAQRIKSNESKLFHVLHNIRTHHRLALSGTPLQNNVLEVFSLMEFILPDMFRSTDEGTRTLTTMLHEALTQASSSSKRRRATSQASEVDATAKEFEDQELQMLLCRRVHKLLSPFLLRREKASVMSQLPKKDDVVIVCPLTKVQGRFLATLERKRDQRLLSGSYTNGVRKVLIHPYLALNSFYIEDRMIYISGKYIVLDVLLRFLHQHGHKTLVFCSWVKVLDIVDSMLTMQGVPFVRLEGKTQVHDREKNIRMFSASSTPTTANAKMTDYGDVNIVDDDDATVVVSSGTSSAAPNGSRCDSPTSATGPSSSDINCFLISKIAGGVGLNLQVADTVILLDTDYNPQRDAQALARVYRVGQTKHVKILRLVTNHPVEARMMEVAMGKHQLEEVVVKAGRYDLTSSGTDRDQHVRNAFETMNNNGDGADLLYHDSNDRRTTSGEEGAASGAFEASSLSTQLLDAVPRSDNEREALSAMLLQHWKFLKDAEDRDVALDVSEEEAAWLRGGL